MPMRMRKGSHIALRVSFMGIRQGHVDELTGGQTKASRLLELEGHGLQSHFMAKFQFHRVRSRRCSDTHTVPLPCKKTLGGPCRGLHRDIIISENVPSACSILLTVRIEYGYPNDAYPGRLLRNGHRLTPFHFAGDSIKQSLGDGRLRKQFQRMAVISRIARAHQYRPAPARTWEAAMPVWMRGDPHGTAKVSEISHQLYGHVHERCGEGGRTCPESFPERRRHRESGGQPLEASI